ncbi:MAG TPA: beta-carotene hydroxylase, partial [Allosphingosinicella sp.]|nr:beta-carotene hydroxylase [Allosphingosinicella sp.]
VGMAVYGLLYLLVHDALVHRRFPFPNLARRGYLKRLVQAHRLHHAVRDRTGAVSFGFLYAPPVRRLKEALRQGQGH